MERWRKQLEKTLGEVNAEISVLKDAKEACERAYEAKALPHDVTTENLSIREVRRQFEVVRDPVEHSLNDENLLIEKCRSILKNKCEDAYDKLSILEDIRQKLEIDLQDKTEALRIDIDQLELTERSTALSHKPDPTRVSKKREIHKNTRIYDHVCCKIGKILNCFFGVSGAKWQCST